MGWKDEAHKAIDEFTQNLKDRLIYGTKNYRDAVKDASGEQDEPKKANDTTDPEEENEKPTTTSGGFKKAAKG